MPSKNQQIAQRFADALTGATSVEDRVSRDRTVPVTREETPWINVRQVRESKERTGAGVDVATLTLNVCIDVRGDPWTDVADPVAVEVHRILMADSQLADLAQGIRHSGSDWDDHEADQTAGCLTLEYEIRYAVSASDISSSTIL
jgi:hypothetical protein